MTNASQPSTETIARVEHALLLGKPTHWRAVDRGYSVAHRWAVQFPGGTSAFVKVASNVTTEARLRREHRFYTDVSANYMPKFLGWDDHPTAPLLAIEDLSACTWPPWSTARLQEVLDMLVRVRATKPPASLQPIDAQGLRGWALVAENAEPFLKLGMASECWLNQALLALLEAECTAPLVGSEFTHYDVRNDNLCFRGDTPVLIDWDLAHIGNGLFDIAFWLSSVQHEGGPQPDVFAGIVSCFFAARAELPIIPSAPGVRALQKAQLVVALPWTVRALHLPSLDQQTR